MSQGMSVRPLGRGEDLKEAMSGTQAVVHLAAYAHGGRRPSKDRLAENVRVTRAAFEAALATSVNCFVNMSSIAAVVSKSETTVSDSTPAGPLSPYGEAKRECERYLDDASRGTGVRVVHLRPPAVYGPRMRGKSAMLFKLIARGVPLPIGGIENRRSFMYVGNVAAAISLALTTPALSGAYVLSDEEPISIPEFARRIAAALGRRTRLVKLPAFLLGDLATSLPVDSTRFWNTAGMKPPFSMPDGLRITAEWLEGMTGDG
jgi:nucleoside-diphosphate-sugar epimerase